MKNITIQVPIECQYLSDWLEFEGYLPNGHIILNKSICGCGCTDFFLTNGTPMILVSPRRRLIESKMKDPRTKGAFYFDRSKAASLDETDLDLQYYLNTCGEQPFGGVVKVPKLMVTYDSMEHLVEKLIEWNLMDRFEIIVDEFTCLFSDVKLKGFTEINLLHRLNTLPNRIVYISATPLNDVYLDLLDEFKDMPYVTLEWDPGAVEKVRIYYSTMISTSDAIGRIIRDYRSTGYFKHKVINGQTYYSKEAVFFLNSVKDIAVIIKQNELTPSDTLVICADDTKNRGILRKVRFKVGSVPGKDDYQLNNKTFTFVTRCSFEGTDFYSDCSTTYVFSDCNRENLALDISIDLRQIVGRCRTRGNVFRDEIYFYYKNPDVENLNENEMYISLHGKKQLTESRVQQLAGINDPGILNKLTTAQKVDKYLKDYLDMVNLPDGSAKAVCNDLAFIADLRAVEIKVLQYKETYQMLGYMRQHGFSTTHQLTELDQLTDQFIRDFRMDSNFERQMKQYVDAVTYRAQLLERIEALSVIPLEFKRYYRELGAERIRRCGYREAYLKRELEDKNKMGQVNLSLEEGRIYSNSELKTMLQSEYDRLGMNKTAKANDIELYADVAERKFTIDGKRLYGYEILKIRD